MESIILAFSLLFSSFTNASYTTTKPLHEQKVMLERFDKVKDDLYYASKKADFDMYTLTAIASAESGFNRKAANNKSSAKGMLQYIDSSWRSDRKKYHKEVGVSSNAKVTDQRANLLIGAKSLAETKEYLINNTALNSKTIQPGDYYLSHFVGPQRAVKILNSNPSTPLTKYMSTASINANYTLTRKNGKRNGRILTTGELRNHLNKHVINHGNIYKREINNYQLTKLIEKTENNVTAFNNDVKPLRMKPMDDVLWSSRG